jgi:hypothetical protein
MLPTTIAIFIAGFLLQAVVVRSKFMRFIFDQKNLEQSKI